MSFTKDNTPLQFANHITYRVGDGEAKVIITEFYVSGYTNYRKSDVEEKVKVGCKSQIEEKVNKFAASNKYYIMYDVKHENANSADAKEPMK